MFVFISAVRPEKGLIELVVVLDDRVLLACWQPRKFPERIRVERIARGKSLDRAMFIEIATAVPIILKDHVIGKTPNEVSKLIGTVYACDWEPSAAGVG